MIVSYRVTAGYTDSVEFHTHPFLIGTPTRIARIYLFTFKISVATMDTGDANSCDLPPQTRVCARAVKKQASISLTPLRHYVTRRSSRSRCSSLVRRFDLSAVLEAPHILRDAGPLCQEIT